NHFTWAAFAQHYERDLLCREPPSSHSERGAQGFIILEWVPANSIRSEQHNFSCLGQPESRACCTAISLAEDREIDAVRDDFGALNCWRKNRLVNFLHQPSRGGRDVKPAAAVNRSFAPPVV